MASAANASVALDIGDGRGALVIYPGERFRGREIHISSLHLRAHTGVHERSTAAGSTLTAIFGSLAADQYTVEETSVTVTIRDGEVTELQL